MQIAKLKTRQISLIIILTLICSAAYADWRELLKIFDDESVGEVVQGATGLTNDEIIAGLKEALSKGTRGAVRFLGKHDGFLGNPDVRIPMPENLQKVEHSLRSLGQDKYADRFIESMNRAAESAVPKAKTIFVHAIKAMTIDDAKNILHGEDDAATQYFRRTSSNKLYDSFFPIVKEATDSVGVTSSYKSLIDQLGPVSSLVDTSKLDLDAYVTNKALEGLFLIVAREEKKIRDDPVARTTELLKKVFARKGE